MFISLLNMANFDFNSKTVNEPTVSELYNKWKNTPNISETSLPRFYYKNVPESNILLQKLRGAARTSFIERKNNDLLENDDLTMLWSILEKTTDERTINYAEFKKISKLSGPKFSFFFTAKTFAKLLQNDKEGRISVRVFFNYVMRKVWFHQTRVGLSFYDTSGEGYLTETELENYIRELIPSLPQLDGLENTFHEFYVATAVRKFFFFLDPMKKGKIKIKDILACSFLDDLLELRDETLTKRMQETNWFSATSALQVYGQYLNLDTNHNGMIDKHELMRYGTGTLTPIFMDRVFQEYITLDNELGYKSYLDFCLAMENRKEPQSLQYFFRLLDYDKKNYLTIFDLNYYFKAIQEQLNIHGHKISFEDVKDEIFDMVKPEDPLKLTLEDLIRCQQGDVVVSILIDLNGFWAYENREALVVDNSFIEDDMDPFRF